MQAVGAHLGTCGCYGRVPSSSHYLTSSRRDTQPYSRGPRRRGDLAPPQSAHACQALISWGLDCTHTVCKLCSSLIPQALQAKGGSHGADMRARQGIWTLTSTLDSPPSPSSCHFKGIGAPRCCNGHNMPPAHCLGALSMVGYQALPALVSTLSITLLLVQANRLLCTTIISRTKETLEALLGLMWNVQRTGHRLVPPAAGRHRSRAS